MTEIPFGLSGCAFVDCLSQRAEERKEGQFKHALFFCTTLDMTQATRTHGSDRPCSADPPWRPGRTKYSSVAVVVRRRGAVRRAGAAMKYVSNSIVSHFQMNRRILIAIMSRGIKSPN